MHQLHLALAESDLSIVGAALEAFRAGDGDRVATLDAWVRRTRETSELKLQADVYPSTLADLHHGYANGLMIDHALPFNIETSAPRFRVMAGVVGLKHQSSEAFMDWLRDLKRRVGLPATLAEAGVPRQIDTLSDLALQDTCHLNNPRPCTRDDFRRIYTAAFGS